MTGVEEAPKSSPTTPHTHCTGTWPQQATGHLQVADLGTWVGDRYRGRYHLALSREAPQVPQVPMCQCRRLCFLLVAAAWAAPLLSAGPSSMFHDSVGLHSFPCLSSAVNHLLPNFGVYLLPPTSGFTAFCRTTRLIHQPSTVLIAVSLGLSASCLLPLLCTTQAKLRSHRSALLPATRASSIHCIPQPNFPTQPARPQ